MAKILIAEDQALIRHALRLLVEKSGSTVVAEASSGREVLELVGRAQPDLVLMDVSMAVMNGIAATEALRLSHPSLPVVMLSSHEDAATVHRAIKAGARGYLLKTADAEELGAAIKAVTRGQVYFSAKVNAYLMKWATEPPSGDIDPLNVLTPRQREVLQLIAEGMSNKEIAFQLGLSSSTVDTHRSELMRRLDVHDVAGLVRAALSAGLIVP